MGYFGKNVGVPFKAIGFKLQASRPWVVPVGFLSGIAIHSFFPLKAIPVLVWCLVAGLLVFCFYLSFLDSRPARLALRSMAGRWRFRFSGMTILFLFCLSLGLLRFDLSMPAIPMQEDEYRGVVQDSSYGRFGWQAYVKIGSNTILIRPKRNLTIGSTVTFACKLKARQQQDETFYDFVRFLRYYQADCSPKEVLTIKLPHWWDVRQTFADLRAWTNRRIMSVLPGDEGALIAGMLYGERGMSQESNELFRRAGLTHLIAVSGSNITIVASVIFALLLGAGLWRRKAFWGTTIILASYVMFTGFSASVARAAAMGWMVLLARHLGRRPQIWRLLILSASILCLIDPWMLGFDAGFALSFMATIGLMIWTPLINLRLKFIPWEVLREAAATSLAATIMTAPYMALAFGRVSLAGLITNLIAVPLVPWAMLFGAVAAAWGNLFGWQLISLPSQGVAKLIFFSASISDLMPFLNLEIEQTNLLVLVATYALLAKIYFKLRKENDFYTDERHFC